MLSFQNLGLSQSSLANIIELGYQAPTVIQQEVIPILLSGKQDLVALAQTGTGKTAAFGLPLIELVNENDRQPQALVLAPTRELCVQITSDFNAYAKNVKSLNITAVYGGASIQDQIRKIKQGSQIIVATPGRLIDLLERKAIHLDQINYFVLDEADEMLKMGFQEAIDTILQHTNDKKSVWLFSATMPAEISRIAKAYMSNPIEVSVGNKNQGNENIAHQFVLVAGERDRYQALKRVIDINTDIYAVVFCRTKIETQNISDKLMTDGYNADALHGDLSQAQRDKVLNNFRNKNLQVLVATDVAARGIDVTDVSHVLHLNLPDELEYYTHRSGRTARAGKKGISMALITHKEQFKLRQIEKHLKLRFEQVPVPTGKEICHSKMLEVITKLQNVQINTAEIAPFLAILNQSLENTPKEEVIAKFVSLEFNQFLDYYRNSMDLNSVVAAGSKTKRDDWDSGSERYPSGTRLFISLGKMDGLEKMDLLALISEKANVPRRNINRIEMKGAYSFFEVDAEYTDKVRTHLHDKWYGDRPIRIEDAGAMDGGGGGGKYKGGSKGKSSGGGGYKEFKDKDKKKKYRY